MKLDLGRIEKPESFVFHEQFPVPLEGEGTVECDAKVAGTVTPTGSRLLLDAEITSTLRVACSRCLAVFLFPLASGFKLVFHRERRGTIPDDIDEEDFILLTDTIESGYDIFPRVREAILLELPIRYLCSEDCKGLCSTCGKNLNEGDCGCEHEEGDSRWNALKKLLSRRDDT
ncbi:MAG: DUF177 domain-containing protein [bacterium]|nr:MAG: DUF177 domain-containing protein [bacterium]